MCVVDLGVVVRLYRAWVWAMPRVTPFYAVKCNNDEAILSVLAALGAGFDCASDAEVLSLLLPIYCCYPLEYCSALVGRVWCSIFPAEVVPMSLAIHAVKRLSWVMLDVPCEFGRKNNDHTIIWGEFCALWSY